MALGALGIIYTVLIVIAIIIQFLLYKGKDNRKNSVFILNMLFGLILSYMAYTSLATNFTLEKSLALAFGIMAFVALALKAKTEINLIVSKFMLTASIVGSFLILYL